MQTDANSNSGLIMTGTPRTSFATTSLCCEQPNDVVVAQEGKVSRFPVSGNMEVPSGGLAAKRESASNFSGGDDTDLETVPRLVAPPPITIDRDYPGTAVSRMLAVRRRVQRLAWRTTQVADAATMKVMTAEDLTITGSWDDIRKDLLKAGGLRDVQSGPGDTSFAFTDFHRVDVTAIIEQVWYNEITDGENAMVVVSECDKRVVAMDHPLSRHLASPCRKTQHRQRQRGDCILVASLYNDDDLGSLGFGGGSWVTSSAGCHTLPRIRDEAHARYQSRIVFKLVWVPTANFDTFVLVDDDGKLLARGIPTLFSHPILGDTCRPTYEERVMNYNMVAGSKYSVEADRIAASLTEKKSLMTQLRGQSEETIISPDDSEDVRPRVPDA